MRVPGCAWHAEGEDVPIRHARVSGDPAARFDVPLDIRIADDRRPFQQDGAEDGRAQKRRYPLTARQGRWHAQPDFGHYPFASRDDRSLQYGEHG